MTVVSTKEFNTNQDKYFDMAVNEDICIKKGNSMFHLIYENQYPEQPILKPDADLRNAITADELIKRIHADKRRNFASRIFTPSVQDFFV